MNSSDNIKKTIENDSNVYGVVGVCGIVGNLIVRMLMDHKLNVLGSDIHGKKDCKYLYTLNNYNIPLYLTGQNETFLNKLDYIIPPPSLNKDSELYKKIADYNINILDIKDLLEIFKPEKPVLCITGTNGKTTTTTLLKHICRSAGLKPTEHGFRNLQGNIDYIPPLQARLAGDVAVLETGTFGKKGDLKLLIENCRPDYGIITNINPDHLVEDHDFMDYANIKREFVEYFKNRTIIVNSDDPTIFGLVTKEDVITFGMDTQKSGVEYKKCWCGRQVKIEKTITGSGFYNCECGLKTPTPDYLAMDIDETNEKFKLQIKDDNVVNVDMKLIGLHNIYNCIGAIAAAREFFNIPLKDILDAVKSFEGVPGRIEHLFNYNGMDVIIDYGHNPAGVETVIKELKKVYNSITVVITVSSESGESGDNDILNKILEISNFIIPASFASRKAAEKHEEYISSGKIILTNMSSTKYKKGTVGATSNQVIEGVKIGLNCNTNALICLGEAAYKYKEDIIKYIKK